MISIIIKTDGEKILDSMDNENTTLSEVGVVLLRLKQIEKKLIDMEFDSDLEITKNE